MTTVPCVRCGASLEWGQTCKRCEAIDRGERAAETGLSLFLGDVASILMAASLTDEKFLDKDKVAAVMQATKQLQALEAI
jgi:hypothetical protein